MEIFSDVHLSEIVSTLVYCLLGLCFFILAYFLIEKIMPIPVRREIEEDQNVALGIIIGSMIIGLAIIIASAIASPTSDKAPALMTPMEQIQSRQ